MPNSTEKTKKNEITKFVIASNIKSFISKEQTLNIDNENVTLPKMKLRKDALDLIMDRLNKYIQDQLVDMKLALPRFSSGERINQIKMKTITLNWVATNDFPIIKKPSMQKFSDHCVNLF